MGRPVHDIDVSFAGGAESFLQCFPQARKTGNGLDIWLVGSTEFTELAGGPRAENGGDSAEAERLGTAVEADLLSRDLTINAAAVDSEGRFFCHPRFMEDMRARVLRLASDSALDQDPLRVFRLARFAAELPDFSIAPETLEAMRAFAREHRERFDGIARERVGRELMKAFAAPKPSRFLTVLHESDCLRPWFQEFVPAAEIPAGPSPWHDNSVLEHTMEVMDRCAGYPLAVWMALCHDIGKVRTEASMLPHHYGHELKGVDLVKELGRRFCLPSRWIRAGVVGTLLHMKGFTITEEDIVSVERKAALWVTRMEALLSQDLPFYKIGIAHPVCPLIWKGDRAKYLATLDAIAEADMHRIFAKAARLGVGIEINMSYPDEERDTVLRPFRIAKEEGCKFYLGSDAHHPAGLDNARKKFERVIDDLELTEEDKFILK